MCVSQFQVNILLFKVQYLSQKQNGTNFKQQILEILRFEAKDIPKFEKHEISHKLFDWVPFDSSF